MASFRSEVSSQADPLRSGYMGHAKRKPTTLAFAGPRDLLALNEMRGPPSGVHPEDPRPDRGATTLHERCEDSKLWAAWAPGLKVALVLAVQDRLHRGVTPSLEAALRPLAKLLWTLGAGTTFTIICRPGEIV